MITQYEVPVHLTRILPVPATGLYPGLLSTNIYKELQYFTDYTRKAVKQHNYVLAKKCFRLADKLYTQGDATVRNAVENVFVFSFSSFIPQDRIEKVILKSFIPDTLYSVYLKQIDQSGC